MGSVQSRKESNTQLIKSDVEIIITEPDYSDNEEEFFECSTDLIEKDLTFLKSDENIPNFQNEQTETNENHEGLQMNSNKEIHTDEESDDSSAEIKKRQQRELEEFREEINRKRALRQQCIKKLRDELKDLNEKLSYQMMINEQLRESIDNRSDDPSSNNVHDENKNLKMELAECQMYLQKVNGENLTVNMENQALRDHIRSLKEVNKAMKEMLAIRECQVDQLKSKLDEIESSFTDKEATILSTDLKQEYQRQLENIRSMRSLYEERSNLLLQENNMLKQQLGDKEHDLETEIEKSKSLEEYIVTLESNLNVKNDDIANLENQITLLRSDKLQINEEMNAANQLISQILFDFNATGNNVNFDMLYSMLEQNRDFLKEMALKEDYGGIDGGSFLPKMLYDLFLQVNQNTDDNLIENSESQKSVSTPEEIALKLPKVWRVLIELLNHQNKQREENKEEDEKSSNEKSVLDDCYKSIQTASGSQAVLSVSKTFIKLRDLIFEKRSLQKDTTRLKTLYSHLEQRLDKQEKKLSSVSLELTKTWHLVGKIKRQHRQLHTHEQILCYQLQQKRRVLNELKAELEYCRKKWALARAINKESEKQCKELRDEFISRKIQDQNSAESGYSDDHASDGDECEKKNIMYENNKERFERNLSEFYRIPLYLIDSDRRRSLELPILYNLFNADVSTSVIRAQSEPPVYMDSKEDFDKIYLLPESQDSDEKSEISCSIVEVEQHLEDFNCNSVLVTLPPDVHELKKNEIKPKIKNDLQKSKRHKKKKTSNSGTETAEEMFKRLTRSINGESSTSTEEIDEELENIEEIPLDNTDTVQETYPVQNEENSSENTDIVQCENKEADKDPVVAAEDDYLKIREARLARLEAETKEFYEKMTRNKEKRKELDNRLTNVHKSFLERQKDKTENSNGEASNSSEVLSSSDSNGQTENTREDNSDDEETK